MTEEQKNKILDDISKNGFSLELKAGRILREAGWLTFHNYVYQDPDKRLNREIDLYCIKRHYKFKSKLHLRINLVSEAKSSTKPWVFFCNPNNQEGELEYAMHSMIKGENYNSNMIEPLFENYPRDKYPYISTSFYEAFKQYSEESNIYKAIYSCTKATYFFSQQKDSNEEKGEFYLLDPIDNNKVSRIEIFIPIIILDGQLIKASLIDNENINIEEVDFIPASHIYLDESKVEHYYLVDVLTFKYLPKYVEMIENWFLSSQEKILLMRDGSI